MRVVRRMASDLAIAARSERTRHEVGDDMSTTTTDLLAVQCIRRGRRNATQWPMFYTVQEYEDARRHWSHPDAVHRRHAHKHIVMAKVPPVEDLTTEPGLYYTFVVDQAAYEAQMRRFLGLD